MVCFDFGLFCFCFLVVLVFVCFGVSLFWCFFVLAFVLAFVCFCFGFGSSLVWLAHFLFGFDSIQSDPIRFASFHLLFALIGGGTHPRYRGEGGGGGDGQEK